MEQGKQQEMHWPLRERWNYTKKFVKTNPVWVFLELTQLQRIWERKIKYRKWVRRIRHWLIKLMDLEDGA